MPLDDGDEPSFSELVGCYVGMFINTASFCTFSYVLVSILPWSTILQIFLLVSTIVCGLLVVSTAIVCVHTYRRSFACYALTYALYTILPVPTLIFLTLWGVLMLNEFRKIFPETREHSDECCAICMEPLHTRYCNTPCGHLFHVKCLNHWSKIKANCPMCRRVLD
jgi:hypothetical protein